MSTSDKTRTKLMDSMRKTKESANAQSTEKAASQSEAKPEAKPVAKPAAKPAPKSTPAKKPTAKAASGNYSSRGISEAGGYQSGGRIWPD